MKEAPVDASDQSLRLRNESRLEPSREQLCQAKAFRDGMRRNGYLIIYSMEKNIAELVTMTPQVLKREGIQQRRVNAEEKATWQRLRDVFSVQMERDWLRAGLTKADAAKPKTMQGSCLETFSECLRLFPGSRLVERRQGQFQDPTAKAPTPGATS